MSIKYPSVSSIICQKSNAFHPNHEITLRKKIDFFFLSDFFSEEKEFFDALSYLEYIVCRERCLGAEESWMEQTT